ncbi:response regulator transcription factor [Nocardioides islandensis]|uniref:Response regulator transcription factor n=1 Tax=Nocardioides islandensis TaxID=433663 RepID=A0A930YDN7_9ACTN|nr:response regulator transcription factor [Nocardioides islandensis]MBF4764456.1 response regulator transcription factor [Nocardioides islandensis]
MTSVLVVEDDAAIRSALQRGLSERGLAVACTTTGLGALEAVVRDAPELVLLDLGLPDIDGVVLISMIRATSGVPIIVITANDDGRTLVRALDAGADDYVVKPFGTDQVAARMRAVLRRSGREGEAPEPLRVGQLVIDERTRLVTLRGEPLPLSRKEFEILLTLAARAGEVVTRRELLASVWRDAYGSSERTLDVHVSWLRRKLGETAAEPRYLVSVRGVGLRLVDPSAESATR